MHLSFLFLLSLSLFFNLPFFSLGIKCVRMYLSPLTLPSKLLLKREVSLPEAYSGGEPLYCRAKRLMRKIKPSNGPSIAPSLSPSYQEFMASPHHRSFKRRRGRHHTPLTPAPGCGITCSDPLTSTPIGTPCGCVIPMKVELVLSIALYTLFPLINELAIEIASGTFLKQSQVQIISANADSQNPGRTLVTINLVPLGKKFDKTFSILTSERLRRKEVPLNTTLFGNYGVNYVNYPGISSPFPYGDDVGSPTGCIGKGSDPITANIMDTKPNISPKIIFAIAFSALVLLVVFSTSIFVLVKLRKARRPSNTIGPVSTPSINRKTDAGSARTLSSSLASSSSMSLFGAIRTSALCLTTFTLAELEKATEKFSSSRILGEGGFGCVYHGIFEDNTEVAVKLLTRYNQNGDREFISEVEMLSRLHHINLVKLIGICIEGHKRCLVYELVRNGSVESHLHGVDREKGVLDWDARLKIALGAARGLAYLHEDSNPKVIHRDFKASNVLLEDDYTPKVSDFGLAREAREGNQHVSTRVMGTFGYVAPEYAMTGHLLVKSDVYSYGVVLLELLTGRKPVDMSQPQGQENLVTWARPLLTNKEGIKQLVDPALSGNYNFDDVAKVASIASMCVHPEVGHRPFMGEVVQALKLIGNEETCDNYSSVKDSSVQDLDSKSDRGHSDSGWWNGGGATPWFNYGQASSFITMDYSSGPLDEIENENRAFSTSSLVEDQVCLPIMHGNRSGPLRTVKSKTSFYRSKGSLSENAGFFMRFG